MWKKMPQQMQLLALMCALSMLTACASGTPPIVGHLTVTAPAAVMQECPPPPGPLQTGNRPELLQNHALAMKQYHQCTELNRAKAEWIRKVNPPE